MTIKTHCDSDRPALSESIQVAVAEGGGVNGRVERDGATDTASHTIFVDSRLLTPDSSEGIEVWLVDYGKHNLQSRRS